MRFEDLGHVASRKVESMFCTSAGDTCRSEPKLLDGAPADYGLDSRVASPISFSISCISWARRPSSV